tara:strand:- start:14 stop:1897 length:1884 start_codon:yes stop_codon:yes gene_type:complete
MRYFFLFFMLVASAFGQSPVFESITLTGTGGNVPTLGTGSNQALAATRIGVCQTTATGDGTTDDTAQLQADIDANGLISLKNGKTYKVTSALIINVSGGGIIGNGAKLIATGDYGDIIYARPDVDATDSSGVLRDLVFRNLVIESSVERTSGAAIHVKWSHCATFDSLRLGSMPDSGSSTTETFLYDGVFAENESGAVWTNCQIHMHHDGIKMTGSQVGYITFWDGLVTGNCNIWGRKTSGAVGVHVAGGCGGVQVESSNISWVENGILVENGNREIFINNCFAGDDTSGSGILIKAGGCNQLVMSTSWGAACAGWGLEVESGYSGRIQMLGGTFYACSMGGISIGSGKVQMIGVTTDDNGAGFGASNPGLVIGSGVTELIMAGNRISHFTNNSPLSPLDGKPSTLSNSGTSSTDSEALFFSADSLSLSDNDSISTIANSGTFGGNATGTAAAIYKASVVNSLPVMRFDGTDGLYLDTNFTTTSNSWTAMVVIHVTGSANLPVVLGGNGGNYQALAVRGDNGFTAAYDNSTIADSEVAPDWGTGFVLFEAVSNSGTVSWYVNGSLIATSSQTMAAPLSLGIIGALHVSDLSSQLVGDIAELRFYDSALSNTDRSAKESTINAKYSLW